MKSTINEPIFKERPMQLIAFRIAGILVTGCAILFGVQAAVAQTFPSKPLRLIAPISPGAASDVVARIISPEMSKNLGQPIVVENKPGADSILGSEYVALQVPPDGYTMIVTLTGTLASFPVLAKDLRFDPLKQLPPVIGLAEGKFTLVSSPKLPWTNFAELVANAKANPGKYNYGVGTALGRILVETFVQELGLKMEYIPYPNLANYLQALTVPDIQMGLISEQLSIAQAEKVRVIAVTGDQRTKSFPDAPTFRELGFPQIKGLSFNLNVPVGVPAAVTERLYAAASKALQSQDVRTRLAGMRLEVLDDKPEVAARKLAEEAKIYADVARKIGLKPQ